MTTPSVAAAPAEADLSPEAYEILRSAVNLARNQGIAKVATLRARLQQLYPGREAHIQAALVFWANYEKRTGGHER